MVNNKIYIGKTIFSLEKRRRVHLCDAKNRLSRRYKCVFHDALLKYGADNFIWEVLDTVLFSDLLLDLEKFYVAKYNCMIPNGYNMTEGGEGTSGIKRCFSDEHKKNIKIAAKNRGPHTEEEKAKIRMIMGSKEVRAKMVAAQGLRRARERGDNAVN